MGTLKFLIIAPNLRSYFETHKNVGENFWVLPKYTQDLCTIKVQQNTNKIEGEPFYIPIHPNSNLEKKILHVLCFWLIMLFRISISNLVFSIGIRQKKAYLRPKIWRVRYIYGNIDIHYPQLDIKI